MSDSATPIDAGPVCSHCPALRLALALSVKMTYDAMKPRAYIFAPETINHIDAWLRACPERVAGNEGRVAVIEEVVRLL